VIVTDNNGNPITYEDSGNGIYGSNLTGENVAKIAIHIHFSVTTRDGAMYESTPQQVVPSPEISDLYCEFDRQKHTH